MYPFGIVDPPSEDYALVQELGATNVRIGVPWQKIQGSDGEFKWEGCGEDKLGQMGITPYFRLRLTEYERASKCPSCIPNPDNPSQCVPLPTLNGNEDCPPSDLSETWRADGKGYSAILYDFVWEVMRQNTECGRASFMVIVGNEVNTFHFWRGTKDQYLRTRATVFKATRDFNLKYGADYKVTDNGIASTIWGRALYKELYCAGKVEQAVEFAKRFERYQIDESTINEQWVDSMTDCDANNIENPRTQFLVLKEMFKVDPVLGGPSFDYMDYHFYDPWDTQEEIINWMKAEMQKNGYSRPIVMTEGGIIRTKPCADGINSTENFDCPQCDIQNFVPDEADALESADNAVKLNVVAFANGVEVFLWLPFESFQFGGGTKDCNLRPFIAGSEKMPLFKSYQVMASELNGFTSVQRLPLGENTYKFIVNEKPVYVLWRNEDTAPNSITVNLSAEISGNVTVTHVDGSVETVASSSLQVTESPIFVEAP